MSQSRLSDLAVLSIENEVTRQTDFDDVSDQFAAMKTRRHSLYDYSRPYRWYILLCIAMVWYFG